MGFGKGVRVRIILALFTFVALAITSALVGWSAGQEATKKEKKVEKPQSLSAEDAFQKARVNGRYSMLLRQIKVEDDPEAGGDFRELGLLRMRRYAGHNDLPMGYWVYVAPHWYIWRDLTNATAPRRAWGPEQATGAPDTPASGDFGTAWASLTPDQQDEWLLLEYTDPVLPKEVRVHENWNPGAVIKISAFRMDGREVEIWNGDDPTAIGSEKGVSVIPVKADFKTNRIKLAIDSKEVKNWNEIDAVGMVDASGKTQWASSAEASSTAGDQVTPVLFITEQRLRILEQEVFRLRKTIDDMKKPPKKDE